MCQNECRPSYSPKEYKRFSYLFWCSDLAAIISLNFITYYLCGIILTGEQTAVVDFREISIQKHLALIITPGQFSR